MLYFRIQTMSPWSAWQVRAYMVPMRWCRPATQDHTPQKRSEPSSLCTTSNTMKAMSARPPVRVNSRLMILKSFQPHVQLIVVDNNLEGMPASVGAVNPPKLCLQEHFTVASVHARHDHGRKSWRYGSSSSTPQWTNAVNISSSESSMGFQRQQRYWLVLSRHCQPWKADREGQQRCDVGRLATQASFTPSTSPTKLSLGIDQVVHASMQQPTFEQSFKARNWAPGKIVLRQGLPPTTKNAVKARHDPFNFALPLFVLEPMHYQCLCKSSIEERSNAHRAHRHDNDHAVHRESPPTAENKWRWK